jgi:2-methylcitrate dehydratase
MSWERALEKFERLSAPYADGKLIESIVHAIRRPEDAEIRELTELLGRVGKP